MDTSVLEDIGLSSTEIKVFLTLLKSGESKAGRIIKKSGLQSSSVYNAINSLIKKGLVSYVKESQIKYYKAADPEVIFDYIDLKKREYEKMLPKLKAYQQQKDEESAQIFRTYRGIKTIMSELLKDVNKGDVLLIFSLENSQEYEVARNKVYTPTKQLVKEKKIKIKGIFHENLREQTTQILASLTPREERVLRMRFGIGMNTDHTLEEVGQQFSVTRERIRQIEAKALRKLKHPSRSRTLKSFLDEK